LSLSLGQLLHHKGKFQKRHHLKQQLQLANSGLGLQVQSLSQNASTEFKPNLSMPQSKQLVKLEVD
jgi:hypothetical protein